MICYGAGLYQRADGSNSAGGTAYQNSKLSKGRCNGPDALGGSPLGLVGVLRCLHFGTCRFEYTRKPTDIALLPCHVRSKDLCWRQLTSEFSLLPGMLRHRHTLHRRTIIDADHK